MRIIGLLLLMVLSISSYAQISNTDKEMEQRIKLEGMVHIQDDPQATQIVIKESAGQKTYERYCVTCHQDGLIGAPKFRGEPSWHSHLSDRTIDDLLTVALKGKNAMPPKGTCYECTDEDIKLAIEYMLPNHD